MEYKDTLINELQDYGINTSNINNIQEPYIYLIGLYLLPPKFSIRYLIPFITTGYRKEHIQLEGYLQYVNLKICEEPKQEIEKPHKFHKFHKFHKSPNYPRSGYSIQYPFEYNPKSTPITREQKNQEKEIIEREQKRNQEMENERNERLRERYQQQTQQTQEQIQQKLNLQKLTLLYSKNPEELTNLNNVVTFLKNYNCHDIQTRYIRLQKELNDYWNIYSNMSPEEALQEFNMASPSYLITHSSTFYYY